METLLMCIAIIAICCVLYDSTEGKRPQDNPDYKPFNK